MGEKLQMIAIMITCQRDFPSLIVNETLKGPVPQYSLNRSHRQNDQQGHVGSNV